ncbi:hypothetical protein E2C01_013514 [Portunus trituberculatus]|uniref:Uncharacterized protein n=1 Tax=Portunus trituberculatus TaxID=210409 RepID=A0A5B7DHI6_PORTR|nr:hypothetical protein [Portunus trituberculatus]
MALQSSFGGQRCVHGGRLTDGEVLSTSREATDDFTVLLLMPTSLSFSAVDRDRFMSPKLGSLPLVRAARMARPRRSSNSFSGLTNMPHLGRQAKYRTPFTEPSFLPFKESETWRKCNTITTVHIFIEK